MAIDTQHSSAFFVLRDDNDGENNPPPLPSYHLTSDGELKAPLVHLWTLFSAADFGSIPEAPFSVHMLLYDACWISSRVFKRSSFKPKFTLEKRAKFQAVKMFSITVLARPKKAVRGGTMEP